MHGIDVETAGNNGGGALTPEEGSLRLIQISDGKQTDIYDAFLDDADAIRRAVEAREELVAHNAVFERRWLKHALGIDRPDLHDTMIMSQVLAGGTRASLNKSSGHSLQAVVKRVLKEEIDKEQKTSDWGAAALTKEQLEYAAKDAKVMPALAATLMSRISRAGLGKVYELERRVSHAVDAMERRGVAIHTDRLDAMIEDSTERAERLKTELTEEWGINPGSSKQLREYFGLDGRKGWPVTDGGAPSTNQEAMKGLLAEEESVAKWLEWKEVEKIRSTYGESLRKRLTPGGRIHARFNPFGTATGRFSSSGPNLQNIPKRGTFGKQMRGLFWSGSDDRVLIKADYASIELWVAAVLWEDPYMQRALQQGVNMHVATAASLFGVKPEEVTKEQKATGKIVNFALLFGGSPNRILEEYKKNGIPIDEEGAQEVHAKFFRTYKGFAKRKEARRARPTTPRSIWARTTTRRAPRSGGGGTLGRSVWPAAPKMNHEIRGMGADSLP